MTFVEALVFFLLQHLHSLWPVKVFSEEHGGCLLIWAWIQVARSALRLCLYLLKLTPYIPSKAGGGVCVFVGAALAVLWRRILFHRDSQLCICVSEIKISEAFSRVCKSSVIICRTVFLCLNIYGRHNASELLAIFKLFPLEFHLTFMLKG